MDQSEDTSRKITICAVPDRSGARSILSTAHPPAAPELALPSPAPSSTNLYNFYPSERTGINRGQSWAEAEYRASGLRPVVTPGTPATTRCAGIARRSPRLLPVTNPALHRPP